MEKEKDQELKIKAEEAISDEVAEATADSKSDEAAGDVTQESIDLDEPDKPEQNAPKEIKSAAPAPQKIDLGENSPFEILELIGQGGMGAVYKAKNKQTGDLFAIKVLLQELADDTTSIKRFKQEAEAAGKLDHVNLANVFGHGTTDDGAPYLVMEYLEGRSLRDLLEEEGRLPPDQALDIFIQVTEGLSYAHKAGIIHRDIKPSNIYLTKNDTGVTIPKVLDFGIAQVRSSSGRETQDLTQTGAVFGSPQYMSPEQCLGFMLDERSDIYSLGCFIYEVVTGSPPFKGDNPIQLVVSHINEQPVGFKREIKAGATMKNLEKIALRCLNKEQGDRYQTIDELIQDLKLVAQNKSIPDYNTGKAKKFSITRRQVITVVATVCLLAGFLPSLLQDWFSYQTSRIIQGCFFGIICIICSTTFFNIGIERLEERFKSQGTQRQWLNAFIPAMLGTAGLLLLCQFYRVFVSYTYKIPLWIDSGLFASMLYAKVLAFLSFVAFVSSLLVRSDKKVPMKKPITLLLINATITALLFTTFLPKEVAKELFSLSLSAERPNQSIAIQLAEAAFRLNPQQIHYVYPVLNALQNQKRYKEGIKRIDKLLKREKAKESSSYIEHLLDYRQSFNNELGNKQASIADLDEIIKLGGQNSNSSMTIKAQRLADEGNLDYALTVLEESIKQNPNYGNDAYPVKINTLIRKNALGEALEETSKLAKFDKTKASWYLLRALIHKKSGNSKAELSDYKRSLESAKTYIAQGNRYSPYSATTDYEAAAYAAEKLGKLDDRDMLLKKYFDTYSKPEKTDLNKHLFLEKTGLEVDWQRTKPK